MESKLLSFLEDCTTICYDKNFITLTCKSSGCINASISLPLQEVKDYCFQKRLEVNK